MSAEDERSVKPPVDPHRAARQFERFLPGAAIDGPRLDQHLSLDEEREERARLAALEQRTRVRGKRIVIAESFRDETGNIVWVRRSPENIADQYAQLSEEEKKDFGVF